MKTLLITLCIAVCPFCSVSFADQDGAMEQWQMARLFHPDHDEMQREDEGAVFIYSGLKDKVVERALDEQFERIEAMMFVRTIKTDENAEPLREEETGEILVEDDGC